MENEKEIELAWLLPDLTQLKLIPETGSELSSLFVVILWTITLVATIVFLFKYFRTNSRLTWLHDLLKDLKSVEVANKRIVQLWFVRHIQSSF